jgi:hypothetical protein
MRRQWHADAFFAHFYPNYTLKKLPFSRIFSKSRSIDFEKMIDRFFKNDRSVLFCAIDRFPKNDRSVILKNHHTLLPKVPYFCLESAILLIRNYGSFDG